MTADAGRARRAPAGWERLRLGEVVQEQNERAGKETGLIVLSSTKYQGLVPSEAFFSRRVFSADLANYKVVRRTWFAYATNHLSEGSLGWQADFDAALVSPMYTVFTAGDRAYPPYLYRLLKSPALLTEYRRRDRGTVDRRGAVRFADFATIPVLLPPLPEQRRAAEVFDLADEAVARADALLAKLRQARQGLLTDLLTRGVAEGGRLREAGTVQDSPLGPVPATWRVAPLAEVLEGGPRNGYSPIEVPEWTGTLMLGLACLTPDGFQPAQLKNAPAGDPRVRTALLRDGDLLLSRSNTRELVALAGVYRDLGTPCIYPDLMMRLTPRRGVDARLLELLLRHPGVRRQLTAAAVGTSGSMVKINSGMVLRARIAVPEPGEQARLLAGVEAMDERIRAEQAVRDKLELQRRGLLEDVLEGRVRT